jgi:hypothetical protein
MDRTGCHPILSNEDLEQFEQGKWTLDEPLSVQLRTKTKNKSLDSSKSTSPILGNIIERKPKAPVAPGAPVKPFQKVATESFDQPPSSLLGSPSRQNAGTISHVHDEIDRENKARIAQMRPDEIREDLEWIKANLSEQAIAFLRSKATSSH